MKDLMKNACYTCNGNCWSCFYADDCGQWLDDGSNRIAQIFTDSKEVFMSLCKGRHEIIQAEDGSIFDTEVDPLDVTGLQNIAMHVLLALKKNHKVEKLNLYVTGLSVALVAVINACKLLHIQLVLWHYNRDADDYYSQEVL